MRKGQEKALNRARKYIAGKYPHQSNLLEIFESNDYPIYVYEVLVSYMRTEQTYDVDALKSFLNRVMAIKAPIRDKRRFLYAIRTIYKNNLSDRQFELLMHKGVYINLIERSEKAFLDLYDKYDLWAELIEEEAADWNNIDIIVTKRSLYSSLFCAYEQFDNKEDIFSYYSYIRELPLDDIYKSFASDFRLLLKHGIPYDIFINRTQRFSDLIFYRWNSVINRIKDNHAERITHYSGSKKVMDIHNLILEQKIEGDIYTDMESFRFFQKNDYCTFTFSHISTMKYEFIENNHMFFPKNASEYSLMMRYTGDLYIRYPSGRFGPASFKSLSRFAKLKNPFYIELLTYILDYYISQGNYIVKDIKNTVLNGEFGIPGTVNEILTFHNKKELMSKYKIYQNPNKVDINVVYIVTKLMPYVDEKSRAYLTGIRTIDGLYDDESINITQMSFNKKKKGQANLNLCHLIRRLMKFKVTEEIISEVINSGNYYEDSDDAERHIEITVMDYIKGCLLSNIPINLCTMSYKKIVNMHNRVTASANIKKIPNFKAPKKSRFDNLKEILPKDYEWIKTRKRLAAETTMMHHCVWSYYDKIQKDESAIYSLWYNDQPYTAEFVLNKKGKYSLRQLYGKYDYPAPPELRQDIENIINKP